MVHGSCVYFFFDSQVILWELLSMNMSDIIEIDGSFGEGGGQITATRVTKKQFRIPDMATIDDELVEICPLHTKTGKQCTCGFEQHVIEVKELPPDRAASMWLLERRWPDRYGRAGKAEALMSAKLM